MLLTAHWELTPNNNPQATSGVGGIWEYSCTTDKLTCFPSKWKSLTDSLSWMQSKAQVSKYARWVSAGKIGCFSPATPVWKGSRVMGRLHCFTIWLYFWVFKQKAAIWMHVCVWMLQKPLACLSFLRHHAKWSLACHTSSMKPLIIDLRLQLLLRQWGSKKGHSSRIA